MNSWIDALFILIIGAALFIQNSAHATADDTANDFMAHFGSGFVAQTVCFGAAKSAFHLEEPERWKATVFCGAANTVLFLIIQTTLRMGGILETIISAL